MQTPQCACNFFLAMPPSSLKIKIRFSKFCKYQKSFMIFFFSSKIMYITWSHNMPLDLICLSLLKTLYWIFASVVLILVVFGVFQLKIFRSTLCGILLPSLKALSVYSRDLSLTECVALRKWDLGSQIRNRKYTVDLRSQNE